MGIRTKMVKGAFWLFLEKGAQQVSSLVVFAVIASMIGPEEYGLIALCGVVLMLMNNITSGIVDSIISMRIRDDIRLSSLFWTVTGGGAILSVITYALAHPFSEFFGQAKLSPLLHATAIMPFLYALSAVPTALITATMDFKIITLRTLAASIAGGITGVYFAFNDWGAFALAAQQIVAQSAIIVAIFISTSWRPRMVFDTYAMGEMLRLGCGQTGSLLVSFLDAQAPRLALGYFLGPTVVGQYSFVIRVCGAIQDGIIQPILNVVYPAISEIIDNRAVEKQVVQQIIFVVSIVMLPLVVMFGIMAPNIAYLFFGPKWASTAGALQLFVIASFFYSISIVLRSILQAHKMIGLYLYAQGTVETCGAIACCLAAPMGLDVTIGLRVCFALIALIVYSFLVWKTIGIPVGSYYFLLWPPAVASAIMGFAIVAFQSMTAVLQPTYLSLILGIAACCIIYLSILFSIEKGISRKIIVLINKSGHIDNTDTR